MTAALVRADALALPVRDSSVDLVVTSPPFWPQREYTDNGGVVYDGQIGNEPDPFDYLDALWRVTAELVRVLKPGGSIVVNVGDKYAERAGPGRVPSDRDGRRYRKATRPRRANVPGIRAKSLLGLPWRYAIGCIDGEAGDPLILRSELVWSKPNGLPESVVDRPRRSHEHWFHFTTSPHYFADMDQIREPYSLDTLTRYAAGYRSTGRESATTKGYTNDDGGPRTVNPLGKLPGSVWEIGTEPLNVPDELGVDHFAAFPQEWPRRLILAFCPPGGVVLDPFGGTGTTAMVARALDRTGISVDMSADYLRLARWRIFDSGHASKAVERTWRSRQGELLGGT